MTFSQTAQMCSTSRSGQAVLLCARGRHQACVSCVSLSGLGRSSPTLDSSYLPSYPFPWCWRLFRSHKSGFSGETEPEGEPYIYEGKMLRNGHMIMGLPIQPMQGRPAGWKFGQRVSVVVFTVNSFILGNLRFGPIRRQLSK